MSETVKESRGKENGLLGWENYTRGKATIKTARTARTKMKQIIKIEIINNLY